jgi:hypothetical protein
MHSRTATKMGTLTQSTGQSTDPYKDARKISKSSSSVNTIGLPWQVVTQVNQLAVTNTSGEFGGKG